MAADNGCVVFRATAKEVGEDGQPPSLSVCSFIQPCAL